MASSGGFARAALACLVAGMLAACGGGGDGDPVDAGRDATDVARPDAADPDDGPDATPRDLPVDRGPDDPGGTDAPDLADTAAGIPCGADDACPDGRLCRTVPDGESFLRLCVPGPDLRCAPCAVDADCRPAGVDTADRCVGTDADGRFCAIDCAATGACPEGYQCAAPEGLPATDRLCVPAAGAPCACPPAAIQQGLSTSCARTNAQGTCPGLRTCSAEGLSACDAPAAAEEECNALDDDCDGQTDEGIVFGTCALQWGGKMCVGPRACVLGQPTCQAGPPADETCNGFDDDCDGETDEAGTPGCTDVFMDRDQDGAGTGASRCDCGFVAPWTARNADDCNDADAAVHPGAVEACDGKDNDCDGLTDPPGLPDCVVAHLDRDQDTYGDPATARCLCGPDAALLVADGTDCDDQDGTVHPGAAEACNGKDDDCDGGTDDGPDRLECQVHYADGDGDTWGALPAGPCLCHPDGEWVVTTTGDCDDASVDLNPAIPETCNDVDDDCDGATDEDFDCEPGIEATEPCGFCGIRRRTCGADCLWPAWSECEGSRTCEPGSLQPCATGCGNLVCTEACEWPADCTWTTDSYETNDTQVTARYFGYFEEPDAPPPVTAWIHGPDDVDWYAFTADEEFPIFVDVDGSLVAWAGLVSGGGYHELCILWDDGPDGVVDDTRCVQGTGDLSVETPDVDPGLLEEAYGRVSVSVRGDASCAPYTLSFDWD